MPQTVTPSIPVPNGNNTVDVLAAIRNWIISTSNQDAGRADLTGKVHPTTSPVPSQFQLTKIVFQKVQFTASDGKTVVIPIIQSMLFTNNVTGQTWTYTAPNAAFFGGTQQGTV